MTILYLHSIYTHHLCHITIYLYNIYTHDHSISIQTPSTLIELTSYCMYHLYVRLEQQAARHRSWSYKTVPTTLNQIPDTCGHWSTPPRPRAISGVKRVSTGEDGVGEHGVPLGWERNTTRWERSTRWERNIKGPVRSYQQVGIDAQCQRKWYGREDGYKSTKYRKPCIGAAGGKVPGYGKALGTWIL